MTTDFGNIRTLVARASKLFAGDMLGGLASVLTTAALVRHLGLDGFGSIAVAISTGATFATIASFDTWIAVAKALAERSEITRHRGILSAGIALDAMSALLTTILGCVLIPLASTAFSWGMHQTQMVYLATGGAALAQVGAATGWYRYASQFGRLAMYRSLVGLMRLAVVSTLIVSGFDEPFVFLSAYVGVELTLSLILIVHSILHARRSGVHIRAARAADFRNGFIRFAWLNSLSSTVRLPAEQLDVIIVDALLGRELAGLLRALRQFTDVITRLGNGVFQALFSDLVAVVSTKGLSHSFSFLARISMLLGVVGLGLGMGNVIVTPWLLAADSSGGGPDAMSLLTGLTIHKVFWLALLPLQPLLLALGYAGRNLLVATAGQVVYIVLIVLLVQYIDVFAVVIALFGQLVVVTLLRLVLLLGLRPRGEMPHSAG